MVAPASESTSELLHVQGLVVRYGTFEAIHDLSVRVAPGAVGLLGPNGAGKSSLLKCVLGLVRPAAGQLRVLGLEPRHAAFRVRQRVGYMPEHPCHFPGLTGFENVAYAGTICGMPRGEARRRAHEVLEYAQLGEERYRPVDDYSTGQRQKVKLASALVHDPDVLLLDEPTNGLDPKGRDEILELIYDLAHNKGLSLILSSHLLRDVETVCSSILVLSEGELKAAGEVRDLKTRLFKPQVRLGLHGDVAPFLRALEARGLRARPLDPLDPTDCLVELPDSVEPRELLSIALQSGCQVRRFRPQDATLEEVFLSSLQAEG